MRLIWSLFSFGVLAHAGTDQWWEMRIGDQPVGYYHQSTRRLPAGGASTTTGMKIVINRMGGKVEIENQAETEETASGDFARVRSITKASAQVVEIDAVRKGHRIDIRTETGGHAYTRTIDAEGRIYGPDAADRMAMSRLKQPGDRVSFRSFSSEVGKVGTITRTVVGEDPECLHIEEEAEGMPGKTLLLVSRDGNIVERRQSFPFGELRMRATDRTTALSAASSGRLPEEMYERTVARSNIRLPDPRSIEKLKIRIAHKRPEIGWPDLAGENQRVVERSADSVVLEIRRPPAPAGRDAAGDAEYRRPNAIIQSDDDEVRRIAKEVARSERNPYRLARRLQDWVAKHMGFDLGVTMAPASEVARNRRGTCMAFATLLAAVERASGLPARIAMGFVYEQGMWGGHAWTEVRIDDHWIPLDSAMYSPGPADAARFHFVVTSLEQGASALNIPGLQMFGNVELTVLEYTIHGTTVAVPGHAKPYELTGDSFRNPWLGVTLQKPRGWRFTGLDSIYPDPTVALIESGNGQRLRLETMSLRDDIDAAAKRCFAEAKLLGEPMKREVSERPARLLSSPAKAMMIVIDGRSLWVLSAEGEKAPAILEKAVAGWSLR